jgi:PncC family amidohydrolase
MDEFSDTAAVARSAITRGVTIAAAESVTAGKIATALAAARDASEWFRGSVVAYQTTMKRNVLGVTSELVITPACARQMADGAIRATGAGVAVAVTGVGGPDPEEDQPAGTVFICVRDADGYRDHEYHFDGDPADVVAQATEQALRHLADALR